MFADVNVMRIIKPISKRFTFEVGGSADGTDGLPGESERPTAISAWSWA